MDFYMGNFLSLRTCSRSVCSRPRHCKTSLVSKYLGKYMWKVHVESILVSTRILTNHLAKRLRLAPKLYDFGSINSMVIRVWLRHYSMKIWVKIKLISIKLRLYSTSTGENRLFLRAPRICFLAKNSLYHSNIVI